MLPFENFEIFTTAVTKSSVVLNDHALERISSTIKKLNLLSVV